MPSHVEPLDDEIELFTVGVSETIAEIEILRSRRPEGHFLYKKVKSRRERRRRIDERVVKNFIDIQAIEARVEANEQLKKADSLAATLDIYASHAEANLEADIRKKRKVRKVADNEVQAASRGFMELKLPGFDTVQAVEQKTYDVSVINSKRDQLEEKANANLSAEARHKRSLGRSKDVYLLLVLVCCVCSLAHTIKCRSLKRSLREERLDSDDLVKEVTELLDGYMEPYRPYRPKPKEDKKGKKRKAEPESESDKE